jgi:hypothetical protein
MLVALSGGTKTKDSSGDGISPDAPDVKKYNKAIAEMQKAIEKHKTMTADEAKNASWWGVEKGENLWDISEQHLEKTWGRQASEKEVADYWQKVCQDNPFEKITGTDDLIHPNQVVVLQDPGADPKKAAQEPEQKPESEDTPPAKPKDPVLEKLQGLANKPGFSDAVENYVRTGDPGNSSKDAKPTFNEIVKRTEQLSGYADKIPGVMLTIVPATHELIGDAMRREYADLTLHKKEGVFSEYLNAIGSKNKEQQIDGAIQVHRYLMQNNYQEHALLVRQGAEKAGLGIKKWPE